MTKQNLFWRFNFVILSIALLLYCSFSLSAVEKNSVPHDFIQPNTEFNEQFFNILSQLLNDSSESWSDNSQATLRAFTSVYSKFQGRPQLLTEETLPDLFHNYNSFNVMIDFIEKIPVRNPGTVKKLMERARATLWLNQQDQQLFTAIFQSLLEIMAHTAKYNPNGYNYDRLTLELAEIPFDRRVYYDRVFQWLQDGFGIELGNKLPTNLIVEGIDNRIVIINGTNYRFLIKDKFRHDTEKILLSQTTCLFKDLLEMNNALEKLETLLKSPQLSPNVISSLISHLLSTSKELPLAEFSRQAPRTIYRRVVPYSVKQFHTDLNQLKKFVILKKSGSLKIRSEKIKQLSARIKNSYLIYLLKHYLVTLAYAINAKNPAIKVFLNPNFVRLHDFSFNSRRNPWNRCRAPYGFDPFAGNHFKGGLSRLHLLFADKLQSLFFPSRNKVNPSQIQAIISNVMYYYPVPPITQDSTAIYQLVQKGRNILYDARKEKEIPKKVLETVGKITSGYRYRKTIDYLSGKTDSFPLPLSEIHRFSEYYLKQNTNTKYHIKLKNSYYFTLGNIVPGSSICLPKECAALFQSGYIIGEEMDDFYISPLIQCFHEKIPSYLYGAVIYTYMERIVPNICKENYTNDSSSTTLAFDSFYRDHLNMIVKQMQREGLLILSE